MHYPRVGLQEVGTTIHRSAVRRAGGLGLRDQPMERLWCNMASREAWISDCGEHPFSF